MMNDYNLTREEQETVIRGNAASKKWDFSSSTGNKHAKAIAVLCNGLTKIYPRIWRFSNPVSKTRVPINHRFENKHQYERENTQHSNQSFVTPLQVDP